MGCASSVFAADSTEVVQVTGASSTFGHSVSIRRRRTPTTSTGLQASTAGTCAQGVLLMTLEMRPGVDLGLCVARFPDCAGAAIVNIREDSLVSEWNEAHHTNPCKVGYIIK